MTKKKTCNFCGRSESEVRLLISGISGQICESCVEQAYEILKSTGMADAAAKGKSAEQYESAEIRQ